MRFPSWGFIAATILLTVYGQVVIKWQIDKAGALPHSMAERISYFGSVLTNPWIITALMAAFFAAISWMAAMTTFELSKAYPFVSLTFVLILLSSGIFFGEPVTAAKVAGVALITLGLVVGVVF